MNIITRKLNFKKKNAFTFLCGLLLELFFIYSGAVRDRDENLRTIKLNRKILNYIFTKFTTLLSLSF